MVSVTITSNIDTLLKNNRRRLRQLKLAKVKTLSNVSTYAQGIAIKLAPIKTGEIVRGITKHRVNDNHYQVISSVSPKGRTGFRQNFWANRTPPYRSVRMRWAGYKKVVYGDGSHRTTGTPGFFTIAYLKTKQKFKKIAKVNYNHAME